MPAVMTATTLINLADVSLPPELQAPLAAPFAGRRVAGIDWDTEAVAPTDWTLILGLATKPAGYYLRVSRASCLAADEAIVGRVTELRWLSA